MGSGVWSLSRSTRERGWGREGEREGTGLREEARGGGTQRKGPKCHARTKRALGWVLARGLGAAYLRPERPLARGCSSAARRSAFIACQSQPPVLKRRGLLCTKGRRPREEGRGIRMPRDHPEESSLSEQLVGRPGGGGLGDTAQPRIHPPPQLASYSGKQGLGPVPTSPSAPSDPLKGRW